MYPSRISKLRQISYIMQSVKKCVSSERLSTFVTHWPPATCEPKVRMFPYVFSSKKMTFFRRALALKIFSAGGVSKRGALSPPLSRKFLGFSCCQQALGGPLNYEITQFIALQNLSEKSFLLYMLGSRIEGAEIVPIY